MDAVSELRGFWRLKLFAFQAYNIGVNSAERSVAEVANLIREWCLAYYAELFEVLPNAVVKHMKDQEPEDKK